MLGFSSIAGNRLSPLMKRLFLNDGGVIIDDREAKSR